MSRFYWENKLWLVVEKCEKLLFKSVIFCFVALVVAQSLLTSNSMRLYFSWAERLEGEPFKEWSGYSARVMEYESGLFANVTIELKDFSSLAKADILINGKKVADFREKKITVKIFPNDILEIDGSFYSRPINFEVVQISSNVKTPYCHQKIQTNNNVELIGKVKFK